MGLDSAYFPPEKISRDDLEEYLQLLGYTKGRSTKYMKEYKASSFHYFSRKPYESLQGVWFTVMIEGKKLIACGRNNVWRNKSDNDFHNYTLRQLRKRFGGCFDSNYGRNRYFPYDGVDRKDADAGCCIATEISLSRLKELDIVSMALINWKKPVQKGDMIWMNQYHPEVTLGNLAITHILSAIETFFKSIYVALLTYSNKKADIIKTLQIRSVDLVEISQGTLRIEEAYANSLNFQNAKYICENFDKLDQSLCIRQTLSKKHGRRKESFFEFVERISSQRHEYVHHGEKRWDYDMSCFKKDSEFCEMLIKSVYKLITQKKNWEYEEPMI